MGSACSGSPRRVGPTTIHFHFEGGVGAVSSAVAQQALGRRHPAVQAEGGARRLPCRIAHQDNGGAARSTGRRHARRTSAVVEPHSGAPARRAVALGSGRARRADDRDRERRKQPAERTLPLGAVSAEAVSKGNAFRGSPPAAISRRAPLRELGTLRHSSPFIHLINPSTRRHEKRWRAREMKLTPGKWETTPARRARSPKPPDRDRADPAARNTGVDN